MHITTMIRRSDDCMTLDALTIDPSFARCCMLHGIHESLVHHEKAVDYFTDAGAPDHVWSTGPWVDELRGVEFSSFVCRFQT